jgi:FOG: CheY-like receiver
VISDHINDVRSIHNGNTTLSDTFHQQYSLSWFILKEP